MKIEELEKLSGLVHEFGEEGMGPDTVDKIQSLISAEISRLSTRGEDVERAIEFLEDMQKKYGDKANELLNKSAAEAWPYVMPVVYLRLAITALSQMRGWVPVTDPPKEETDEKYLLACDTCNGRHRYVTTAFYQKSTGFFNFHKNEKYIFGAEGTDDKPVAWMPLPEPPEV